MPFAYMYPYSFEFDYMQGEALVMGYDIMGYTFLTTS